MKKFTNLDKEHHHDTYDRDKKSMEDQDFSSENVDSIMISDQQLLEETNTHLMHANV